MGNGSNTLKKAILTKIIWIVLAFVALYAVSYPLGFAPQYMKDTVAWFSNNIYLFAFLLCFMTGAYIFFRIKMRRRTDYE